MVRETGLEPARPKTYAPKAYVYTNFTTRAQMVVSFNYSKINVKNQDFGHHS